MNKKGYSQLKLPIYYVDAFTENIFRGNPAAIVVVKENLSIETMQAIAFENKSLRNSVCQYILISVLNPLVYSNR